MTVPARCCTDTLFRREPIANRPPKRFASFAQRMPAAKSALRRPQSTASEARLRTAVSRRLMALDAWWCCSTDNRYRVTTILLKASLGSGQYPSMNSPIA